MPFPNQRAIWIYVTVGSLILLFYVMNFLFLNVFAPIRWAESAMSSSPLRNAPSSHHNSVPTLFPVLVTIRVFMQFFPAACNYYR